MIRLDADDISFPDPMLYNPDQGVIAIGGDLRPERLYFAYQLGIFPWYNDDSEILWWCPDPRFILVPNELKISKSMSKILNRNVFSFTENKNFEAVIKACQTTYRPDQDGTWLNDDLIKSFIELHKHGIAHSIEVWQNEELVGGFYGIKIGRVFCGESMFSKVSNASKAGFINFCKTHVDEFDLIDCQVHSEHLESLGAKMISKKEYLTILYQSSNVE
ncbi:leucyl/phenylalanyl-tRNA--protein transferase [Soonwooa buanensis]|uniref:Leucyl/phenylalanyl-tRNA--protein transferase n=1 Tax=Soonwooa buanensis TaxID=619805 RepID=A0A1T5EFU1_9FLAO|nr:leucyl/phenylalanyl-tRNA--protein transferase [Soonwooa buanensis]SKB82530.1 leucyl/phenylalanyl-tRNA--protein transferase [Soonwooa buanensis]